MLNSLVHKLNGLFMAVLWAVALLLAAQARTMEKLFGVDNVVAYTRKELCVKPTRIQREGSMP